MLISTIGVNTNISITNGESVAMPFTLAANGTPINLSGYSLKMRINLPTPLDLTTSNSGIVITNAATGSCQVNIDKSVTATMPVGPYPYDLWMISGGGVETPLLSGNFSIIKNISPVP